MKSNKKLLKKITSKEFGLLIMGVKVNLSLENNQEFICYDKSSGIIIMDNILVEEDINIRGHYKHNIYICGNSKINANLHIHPNTRINILKICDKVEIFGNLLINTNVEISCLLLFDESKIGNISLNGNIHKLEILGKSQVGDFQIYRANITSILIINAKAGNFNIHENAFVENISIYGDASIGYFSFSSNAVIETFSVSQEAKIKFFTIRDNAKINIIHIKDNVEIGEFNFDGGEIAKEIIFKNLITKKIIFKNSGTTFFPKRNSKILLTDMKLEELSFINFHTDKIVQINSVNSLNTNTSFIQFTRSSFSKLELIGNKFHEFNHIKFDNSDLTKSFIANTSFPNLIKKEEEDSKEQEKLFFEQLKTVFTKQGNRTEALKCQAKELNAFYKSITWKKEHFRDKLTLCFSKWSNEFGTDWIKGIKKLIKVTIPIYILIILFNGNYTFNFWEKEIIAKNISLYLKFIFPFPSFFGSDRFVDILDLNKNVFIIILLVISYIFIAIMYYQIIQAFRKFGKK